MKKILLVHQNFPGQFKHLAPALAKQHQIYATSMNKYDSNLCKLLQPTQIINYGVSRGNGSDTHPWVTDFETKIIRAEAALNNALKLKKTGFYPDLIYAHPGWGESLFLNEVWPKARLAIYAEYYYQKIGADYNYDPEFPQTDLAMACLASLKNINNDLHLNLADFAISPTSWQANTYPVGFRKKISIIHDGINTKLVCPNESANLTLSSGQVLTKRDQIITFVNRNLEPYRGYHSFMRSLPALLRKNINLKVLIVGGQDKGYGPLSSNGKSWQSIFFDEIKPALTQCELERIFFLGKLPYEDYIKVLQVSTVHVYFSYPFVLSWSMLEAMSAGCALVANNAQPIMEFVEDEISGLCVDLFDIDAIQEKINFLLENPEMRSFLGKNARDTIKNKYDLHSICLPKHLAWVDSILN